MVFVQCSVWGSLRISRSTIISWKKWYFMMFRNTVCFVGSYSRELIVTESLPSAKAVHGQQMSSFQIYDYLWLWYIAYSRKIFPCIYALTFNPVLRMSDFWTAKPTNSQIKRATPTLSNHSTKAPNVCFFPEEHSNSGKTLKNAIIQFCFSKFRKKPPWNPLQKHVFWSFQVKAGRSPEVSCLCKENL